MRPKPTCLRRLSLIFYICFCLAPALLAAPARKGLLNLRGHKAVGGLRASLYNAMPVEGARALVDFMKDFEVKHRV